VLNKITCLKKNDDICIVVILSPLWQMASNKTTPTALGIGARTPLGIEGEVGGEGSETHLPTPPELPFDLAQVLANQKADSLRSSLEASRTSAPLEEDLEIEWESS
jgi:hypothetical protein